MNTVGRTGNAHFAAARRYRNAVDAVIIQIDLPIPIIVNEGQLPLVRITHADRVKLSNLAHGLSAHGGRGEKYRACI